MDKELDGIDPGDLLKDTVVNTVHTASKEEALAAAAEEKEKKQDYYVDPLEQDDVMKEKLKKIEEEREKKNLDNATPEEEKEEEVDLSIRPDMNVSGFFSAGNTATKQSIMHRPASKAFLNFCMIFGVINATYSAFYLVVLISDKFLSPNWFMGWLYAIVVILSVIIIINGVRSLKVQKDSLKRKALIGIVGSGIAALPLFAWIFHIITQLF